jgi:hypothetical protein
MGLSGEKNMSQHVDISFRCIPLRSVGRFDPPVDATDEQRALIQGIHKAVTKHGAHNAYYLCDAHCIFHFTNDKAVGTVAFRFEGTVLTDAEDQHTTGSDLSVELEYDICDWLTSPAIDWLRETVSTAVRVEFDRFIATGDLRRTLERQQRMEAELGARGGYLGMGL